MYTHIKKIWDYYSHNFQCEILNDHSQGQAFLRTIFHDELRRPDEIQDNPELVGQQIHMSCVTKKELKMIGCLEAIPGRFAKNNAFYRKAYQLHTLPEGFIDNAIILDLFAISGKFRKTIAARVLFEEFYRLLIKNNYAFCIISCEPGLRHFYNQMGFVPYTKIHLCRFGYVIPCLHYIQNYNALKKMPKLYKIAKELHYPKTNIRDEQVKDFLNNIGSVGFESVNTAMIDRIESDLTHNLPKQIKYKLFLGSIMLYPDVNDIVLTKDDGNKFIALVYKGKFAVMINNKEIAELNPGDIIGEISFITKIGRTASVICKESESALLIPSLSAISRIRQAKYSTIIWKNLSNILAKKIIGSNKNIF